MKSISFINCKISYDIITELSKLSHLQLTFQGCTMIDSYLLEGNFSFHPNKNLLLKSTLSSFYL